MNVRYELSRSFGGKLLLERGKKCGEKKKSDVSGVVLWDGWRRAKRDLSRLISFNSLDCFCSNDPAGKGHSPLLHLSQARPAFPHGVGIHLDITARNLSTLCQIRWPFQERHRLGIVSARSLGNDPSTWGKVLGSLVPYFDALVRLEETQYQGR